MADSHPDQAGYGQFTRRQRVDRAVHTLTGLLHGIAIDDRLDAPEISELLNWCNEYRGLATKAPFSELIPKLDKVVTAGNFAEKTGYATQRQFLEGKALTGDSSDAIPGVGGLGDVGAVDFMAEYGSVKGFLAEAKAGSLPEKLPAALQRFLDNKPFTYRKKEYPPMIGTFVRNMKLMDLMNVEKPDPELTKMISLPVP